MFAASDGCWLVVVGGACGGAERHTNVGKHRRVCRTHAGSVFAAKNHNTTAGRRQAGRDQGQPVAPERYQTLPPARPPAPCHHASCLRLGLLFKPQMTHMSSAAALLRNHCCRWKIENMTVEGVEYRRVCGDAAPLPNGRIILASGAQVSNGATG